MSGAKRCSHGEKDGRHRRRPAGGFHHAEKWARWPLRAPTRPMSRQVRQATEALRRKGYPIYRDPGLAPGGSRLLLHQPPRAKRPST
ncbi:MAG: hypothetical protein MZU95_00415 [Desulfomicrobium escambiense]|nr:hypothetical protein [Desulfomicrobium escambiense]